MSTSEGLFSPNLISSEIAASFPDSHTIRPLEKGDYAKGFLECLKVLSSVGEVTEEKFNERYDWMSKHGKGAHYYVVIEHEARIVGTGPLIVERKFIHNLGTIGHIEEIAIKKDQQGKKLGLRLLQTLGSIAVNVGCYKTNLGTSQANEPFYVKCGYEGGGRSMSQYYEEAKPEYERG